MMIGIIKNTPYSSAWCISTKIKLVMQAYAPKGCPFNDYTMYDLLKDLIDAYSWKITGTMPLDKFIILLQKEGYPHAVAYGDDMLRIMKGEITE